MPLPRHVPTLKENKNAGHKAFKKLRNFTKWLKTAMMNIKAVRLPLLNISEDTLIKSDKFIKWLVILKTMSTHQPQRR